MPVKLQPLESIKDVLHEYDNDQPGLPFPAKDALEQIRAIVQREFAFWEHDDGTFQYWACGYWQSRLADVPNAYRFTNAERVYVEQWIRENDPSPGVNSGEGILQHLLSENAPTHWRARDSDDFAKARWEMVTRRDWIVATAVIQWLGTNVGRAFVESCERRIAEQTEDRRRGFSGR